MISKLQEFLSKLHEAIPVEKGRHSFTLSDSGVIELAVLVEGKWISFEPDDEDMEDFEQAINTIEKWVAKTLEDVNG